jgi:hypothetical protein
MNWTVLDTMIGAAGKGCGCGGACAHCGGGAREAEAAPAGLSQDAEAFGELYGEGELGYEDENTRLRGRRAGRSFRPSRRPGGGAHTARPAYRRSRPKRYPARPRTAARANSHFSRRLGWSRNLGQISKRFGLPKAPPWSLPLVLAIARWQEANGLPVTGVLGPSSWAMLRDQTAGAPADEPPAEPADGGGPEPTEPAPDGAGQQAEPAGADAGAPVANGDTGGTDAEAFI